MTNEDLSPLRVISPGELGAGQTFQTLLELRRSGQLSAPEAARLLLQLDRTIANANNLKVWMKIKTGKTQGGEA